MLLWLMLTCTNIYVNESLSPQRRLVVLVLGSFSDPLTLQSSKVQFFLILFCLFSFQLNFYTILRFIQLLKDCLITHQPLLPSPSRRASAGQVTPA